MGAGEPRGSEGSTCRTWRSAGGLRSTAVADGHHAKAAVAPSVLSGSTPSLPRAACTGRSDAHDDQGVRPYQSALTRRIALIAPAAPAPREPCERAPPA